MNNDYLKEQLSKFNENTPIRDLQKYTKDMSKIRGFDRQTPQDLMLSLTEEIGELAKEIKKSEKYKIDTSKKENNEIDLSGEIADIFIYLLSMCNTENIDLLEAFKNKEEINCKREWK